MDHFTIDVRKIANGFTVSRTLYANNLMTHDEPWFFKDMDGVKAQMIAWADSAEADANNMPPDAEHHF